MNHDPYAHTVEPAIELDIFEAKIEAPNGNKLPCDVRVEYTYVSGRKLITDVEVKIMFTPANWQEGIIAIIEERHQGCEFNAFPAWKMIKQKLIN